MRRHLLLAFFCACALAAAPPSNTPARVDAVFEKWTNTTPGCAVGVATNGVPVLAKGYGMADLEHDVPITAQSIFEAGSVSKQFTAAAVLLLAREGKLSLDDQVRKYIPELPDYGSPLTIRHMLNHTSGLRDWGSVAAIAGWPRTRRVHTQANMLDIASRQTALNFVPGTHWSYSNTGYNLAAMIVTRVSGKPFPEFTRERLFVPLNMTHTSWRDDFTRVVKGRAIAYSSGVDFHTDMPFEDVYGNGGLLTTVGDLLKWNEHFDAATAGDAELIAEQQRPGQFNDGRPHGYGLGLFLETYKGIREVNHSGSTAGYQAFLTRFPAEHVSVAVLCNVSSATPAAYAHDVAEVFLGDAIKTSQATAHGLTAAQVNAAHGLYRSTLTGLSLTMGAEPDSRHWTFDAHGAVASDAYGTSETYQREAEWTPPPSVLAGYTGTYASDEAEAEMTATVEAGHLQLKRRPDTVIELTPIYLDAFKAGTLGTIIFRRDAAEQITAFSVVQDRVWDLRFRKRPGRS
ncbi:MAG TPA: serine hydrolase domain-containing protein [Vicinamibacterales bacterium]|jgi:CubicO group peptidase (beta-lactamase class C family)